MPSDVLTIILGGGRGARLYPLTKFRSKPAVPIAGKYRLIDIPISNCVHSGFFRVYVLTQFMSMSLNRHIATAYTFDHLRRGFIEVIPATQSESPDSDWFQGTADAVRKSRWHYRQHSFQDYLILSGDHLYRMDYRNMLRVHRKSGADVTVATLPVAESQIAGFGIMRLNEAGRIVDFVEKPKDVQLIKDFKFNFKKRRVELALYPASMGIYIFKRKILENLLSEHPGNDFGYDMVPYAIHNHHTQAYKFSGYWEDIGKVSDFFRANLRLTKSHPSFSFYDPRYPIYSRPRHLPGSLLDRTQVETSIICDGCIIKNARISDSIIGIRSIIAESSQIQSTLMMGSDFYEGEGFYPDLTGPETPPIGIGPGCVIENAIIDKNARLGAGVVIKPKPAGESYDGEGYAVREGITIIEKNAIIPGGTVI